MYLVATSWRRSSNASCVWVKLNWNRKSTTKKKKNQHTLAHKNTKNRWPHYYFVYICLYVRLYVHSPLGLLASYLFRCSFETTDCTSSNVRQLCIDEIPIAAYLLDAICICIRRDNPQALWKRQWNSKSISQSQSHLARATDMMSIKQNGM